MKSLLTRGIIIALVVSSSIVCLTPVGAQVSVDMDVLVSGDADDSGAINMTDFGIWKTALGATIGDPNWDARADFNLSDTINMTDFGMWKINLSEMSPQEV